MKNEVELRLRWIELYEKTQNAELVCLRCGISPPTLYKWLGRYRQRGKEGLKSLSHKGGVHHQAKVTPQYERRMSISWWRS